MAHEWMEELTDNLLYLGLLFGAVFFFARYQSEECQLRCAELVVEDFLYVSTVDGRITSQEYQNMITRLNRLEPGYEAQVVMVDYELQPCYALLSQEELDRYYMNRNIRKEMDLQDIANSVTEVDAAGLKLQKETNASVMAAGAQDFLPLPEEETTLRVEAVRPKQEIYEGEPLITVCKVSTESGNYYAEATDIVVWESGTVWLELWIQEMVLYVPVEVVCYPRYTKCENRHVIVNTEEVVDATRNNGNVQCPYCAMYPVSMECRTPLIDKKTGCNLTKEEIWLEVCYMDGHRERVTPDSVEWQDNYDENYCGIQPVTIRYRGLEEMVMVISENEVCKNCDSACNERCFGDYEKFPYCTACMSEVLLFTGETYYEEQVRALDNMFHLLQKNEKVELNLGEYLAVILKKDGEYQSLIKRMVQKDGKAGDSE